MKYWSGQNRSSRTGSSGPAIGVACGYDVRLFALQEITPSTTDDTAKDSPLENACYDVTVFADVTLGVVIQSLSVSHNYFAAMSSQEVHVLRWQISGAAHLSFSKPVSQEMQYTEDTGTINGMETTESAFVKDPHCIVWSEQTIGEISATTSSRPSSCAGSRRLQKQPSNAPRATPSRPGRSWTPWITFAACQPPLCTAVSPRAEWRPAYSLCFTGATPVRMAVEALHELNSVLLTSCQSLSMVRNHVSGRFVCCQTFGLLLVFLSTNREEVAMSVDL